MTHALRLNPVKLSGFSRIYLPVETASTNADGRALLENPDALERRSLGLFSLIATGQQTAGKGRLDREWTAPADTSLSTSLIVRPHADAALRVPLESYHWATLVVALAAVQTIKEVAGVEANIKWPNDVMVGEKKICGVLANLVVEPDGKYSIVVGIGTNINLAADELPVPTATSLLIETDKHFELEQVLATLARRFETLMRDFLSRAADPEQPLQNGLSLLDTVRQHMSTLGQNVRVHLPEGSIQDGTAVDLNSDGEILVRLPDGIVQSYAVGDIVHLRPLD